MKDSMKKDKLLIIGAGYLGQHLFNYFSDKYTTIIKNMPEIDVTNIVSLDSTLNDVKPRIVINAAAYTDVDGAENPIHQNIAFDANVKGPLNLAHLSHKYNFELVHISTGMIFDGNGNNSHGFTEEDTSNPTCYYAWTKAWCDAALTLHHKDVLITRIHMPVSGEANQRNLLFRSLHYDKGYTGKNTITVVEDFLVALDKLISKKAIGIYHIVNNGEISAYEIINKLKISGLISNDKKITKINRRMIDKVFQKYGRAIRPDSIISNSKLSNFGINMPDIEPSIDKCIAELKAGIHAS